MAVKITGTYKGGKQVELCHEDSGAVLYTSAPLDNAGDGSSFSPTDLLAAGLGSCILTTIAIVADREKFAISQMSMRVEKHMQSDPRRISSLPIGISLPKDLSEELRRKCEYTAKHCPVYLSLSKEISIALTFRYEL